MPNLQLPPAPATQIAPPAFFALGEPVPDPEPKWGPDSPHTPKAPEPVDAPKNAAPAEAPPVTPPEPAASPLEEKAQRMGIKARSNGEQREPRPWTPDRLKAVLATNAGVKASRKVTANDQQRGLVAGMLELCFAGHDDATQKRRSVLKYLVGVDSTKELAEYWVIVLLDWLKPSRDSGDHYQPDPMAVKETQAVLAAALKEAGQQELPL